MMRVLVIEDNRDTAESLRTLLMLLRFETKVCLNGRDGVEVAQHWLPNVVLCDIGLPELDGFEVAQALRGYGPTSHALLVAISGYGSEENQEHARQVGFDRFFTKPADFTEVYDYISHNVGHC